MPQTYPVCSKSSSFKLNHIGCMIMKTLKLKITEKNSYLSQIKRHT